MQRMVAALIAFCLLINQSATPAAAQDAVHEARIAAEAAHAIVRGSLNAATAQQHVPGYTTTPSESALFGRPDLADAAAERLAACSAAPLDPTCQALLGAITSANTPRTAVPATDPVVAAARAVAREPAQELGSLSTYYTGCTSIDGALTGDCPDDAFCLGEVCFSTAYLQDADFSQAMAVMEATRQAGIYLDPETLQVFQGEGNRCRDRLFNNCCSADASGAGMTNQSLFGTGSRLVYDVLMNADNRRFVYQGMSALLTGSGYSGAFTSYGVTVAVNGATLPTGAVTVFSGQSIVIAFNPWALAIAVVIYVVMSMMSCSEDEGLLAMKEGANLCHSVGSYCSSCIRALGSCVSCIERTTGKCCFNSLLARIINEQARQQFGKGWGDARNPDCSGFTVEQLQAMDFSAMDLTEFYASIVPVMPDAEAIRDANADRIAECYYGQGLCP